MTAYQDFIRDFPARCLDLLHSFEGLAADNNREITLLLTVASAGLLIPLERLNPSAPDHVAPDRYQVAVRKLGRLQNRSFLSWHKGTSWRITEDVAGDDIRQKTGLPWLIPNQMVQIDPKFKVGSILARLRNSLAHGNILTVPYYDPSQANAQITNLIFLSKRRDQATDLPADRYDVLSVQPGDFRVLIEDWLGFLVGLKLPATIA